MANKNPIKVFVRTKPTSNFAQDIITILGDSKSINVKVKKREEKGFVNNQQETWGFAFDEVLDNVSQDEVYEKCAAPVTQSVLDGYNGTVMCYGQTGAGKTFTMTGTTENYRHRGMIPRAIAHIFKEIKNRTDSAITVRVSYVELYNESMYDLLAFGTESNKENNHGNGASAGSEELKIIEDSQGNTSIMGLTQQIANSEEEALHFLFEGETNRAISEHQLNKSSTRSHCIFTLHLDVRSRVESSEKITLSKLNLVDLAGSERLKKTQSEGIIMREAMYINKSLTFLEQVIIALSDKHRDHIPYRRSKLTNILKDSLGGNCKTHMIANVWTEAHCIEETISTLKFATRMMRVSNEPIVNVTYDPAMLVKKYEREIKDLKAELAMHDTLSNKSHIQYETYTDTQRNELNIMLRKYLAEEVDDIEVINLRQIKEMLIQFRVIFKDMERETELKTKQKYVREKPPEVDVEQANAAQGEDEGVGDVEGGGFGVGLASSNKIGTPKSKLKPAPKVPFSRSKSGQKLLNANPSSSPPPTSPSPLPAPTPLTAAPPSTSASNLNPNNSQAVTPAHQAASQNGSGGGLEAEKKKAPNSKQAGRRHNLKGGFLEGGDTTKRGRPHPQGDIIEAVREHDRLPPINSVEDLRGQIPAVEMEKSKPPPKEEEKKKDEKRMAPSDKNVAFTEFKAAQGADLNNKMRDNKELLKDRKKQLKTAGSSVNAIKSEIDTLKDFIDQKKQERLSRPEFQVEEGDDTEIIDEDEFRAINRMREAKRAYRDAYEQLRAIQTEVDTVDRMTEQCRQRLISDFEMWYANTFVQDPASISSLINEKKGTSPLPIVNGEDIMDFQEKFDKIGFEKVVQLEPEAAAFYSAYKHKKDQLAKQKIKSPPPKKKGSPTKWI